VFIIIIEIAIGKVKNYQRKGYTRIALDHKTSNNITRMDTK